MIIDCPECHTKFAVPDTAIGPGRDVRCGKCTHVWFIAPLPQEDTESEGEDNAAEALTDEISPEDIAVEADDVPTFSGDMERDVSPIPEGSALPVIVEKRGASSAMIAACVALLLVNVVLGLLTFRDTLKPALSWLYAPFGIYATDGVALTDFTFEQRELGKKFRITLGCAVVNQSDEVRRVPALSARLVTAGGDALGKESNLLDKGKYIKPGGRYDCGAIRMTNPFSSAKHLVLDLGNPFDIGQRE